MILHIIRINNLLLRNTMNGIIIKRFLSLIKSFLLYIIEDYMTKL